MKSRLQFGMSLAFEFDVYISDEATAAGDASFTSKAARHFKIWWGGQAIMVAHSPGTFLQNFAKREFG